MVNFREWFDMSGATVAVFQNQRSFGPPPGSDSFTSPGNYGWVAPTGVTRVSVVVVGNARYCIGGALSYKNNYAVTPGNAYAILINPVNSNFVNYFNTSGTVAAGNANCRVGDGGGAGGYGNGNAGGGAGGYSGSGGAASLNQNGATGSGGGGGAGGSGYANCMGCCGVTFSNGSGGGGGVGLFGQGSNGLGGTKGTLSVGGTGGGGGSGGANGTNGTSSSSGNGGAYGGGYANSYPIATGTSATGAVRVVYPGNTRQFPSTNVGTP